MQREGLFREIKLRNISKNLLRRESGRRQRPSVALASLRARNCSARVYCRWSLGWSQAREEVAPRTPRFWPRN